MKETHEEVEDSIKFLKGGKSVSFPYFTIVVDIY